MTIADDLAKLEGLHRSGALTDDEFASAKAALLKAPAPAASPPPTAPDLSRFDPDAELTPQILRVMQIIAGALLAGVSTFLVIVIVIRNGPGAPPPQAVFVMTPVAAVFLALLAPLAFMVPGIMTRSALRQINAGTWPARAGASLSASASVGAKLIAVRQTTLLVGLALLEGAAFNACIAYLLEGQVLALAVVGVAIALILSRFPTRERVRNWLERQASALAELRQEAA
jgi:hypothetical protein